MASDLAQIGPLFVRRKTAPQASADIVRAIVEKRSMLVAFANTHLLYFAIKDQALSARLASYYILNDGIGMALMARIASGRGFPQNLNGTDFTPYLLQTLPRDTRVMLVGAKRDVVLAAASWIKRRYRHIHVCGACDGYEDCADGSARALAEIEARQPHLILAAMGNPLQENWMHASLEASPGRVFIGVGALFDYFSMHKERAPHALQWLRLEWLYRLWREPKRLWRRYTVEMWVVLLALLRERTTRQGAWPLAPQSK
jgi:exopolysaccharide biosynthesis WecB/TagA/CpsF family protein